MEFLQELFVTAILAVLFSFIVAISIAMSGSQEKNNGSKEEEKKMVVEEMKLEKRLKVRGGKSKKRVKFADDVVFKNVDHFEVVEEPIKDSKLSDKLSEKVGFLDNLSGGLIVSEESEEAKVIEVDDQFGGEGVVKESEVMPCIEELDKECDDASMSREVKCDDDQQKGCKDAELLDKVLKRYVVEKETEAAKADEFHGVESESKSVGCLKALDVGDKMMSKEIGSEAVLELVKGDVDTDQKGGDEARDSESASRLLGEALEEEAIETNTDMPEVNLGKSSVSGGLEDVVVDKKLKSEVLDGRHEVEMAHYDTAILQIEEDEVVGVGASAVVETKEEGLGKGNEVKQGLVRDKNIDDDDDDWEGVESSELEKVFAEAVNFVECGGKGKDDQMANLGSDVQMRLYGLQRLALEGPCHEPQPMALKISARAKWNAWQRLGSMSPEVAMEKYIKLLSETDSGWMQHSSAGDGNREFIGNELTGSPETKKSFLEDIQGDTEDGRKLELEKETVIDADDSSSGAKSQKEISG